MRQKALEADIVVVNHHLFFADLAIRKDDAAAILPDYSAVIFDEAHELEEIATEYFGFHVSNFRINDLLQDIRRSSQKLETPISETEVVQRVSDHFFGRMLILSEGRHPVGDLTGIEGVISALQELQRSLKKVKNTSDELETLARRSGEIADALEVFRSGLLENYVSWIERQIGRAHV